MATQPLALEPELEPPGPPTPAPPSIHYIELSATGPGREASRPEPAATSSQLASSISILDLARRSFRSKSRCFCSRSASRSVTCFCRSASFWRSSVIWVQRKRGGVREGRGEPPRFKAPEKEAAGGRPGRPREHSQEPGTQP